MKLIIAGSRDLNPSKDEILGLIGNFEIDPQLIVSGAAKGVDSAGEEYAHWAGIPIRRFYADWSTYGRSAGPRRNRVMAHYADALLLIWDGKSRGSKNMKEEMLNLKKPVYEIIIRSNNDSK